MKKKKLKSQIEKYEKKLKKMKSELRDIRYEDKRIWFKLPLVDKDKTERFNK